MVSKFQILFLLTLLKITTQTHFDVVIYGGTSGGIISAVAASKHGSKVAIIEPHKRLGGMSASGLGHTDIGNNQTEIGGLAHEFYKNNTHHYNLT